MAARASPTPPTEVQTQEKMDWLANHPHAPPVEEDGPRQPPETGIFPSGESFWPPMSYRLQNQWGGIDGDIQIRVWAGAYGSAVPSLEGRGVVVWASIDWTTGTFLSMDVIPAPPDTTALTITGADGHLLTLQTEEDQTFTFDADTKELSKG
jgi:hypothetical protein